MHLHDTVIQIGGVFRCCLGSVASEYKEKEVELGDTSECKYCHEKFTLLDMGYKNPPKWCPDALEKQPQPPPTSE